MRILGVLAAVLVVAGCGRYPPATRCSYSFSPGRCVDRATRSDKPVAAHAMPSAALEPAPPTPAVAEAAAPCAPPDVLVATVADRVHGATACAGISVTPRADGDVNVRADDADLAGCLRDPIVHAALAELERCRAGARAPAEPSG